MLCFVGIFALSFFNGNLRIRQYAMEHLIHHNKLLLFLVFIYLVYGFLLIFRSSFTLNGANHFVLFDDEMISMRYARNLTDGNGFVWNPGGERVEGITNPLWTLYLVIWHVLPIPPNLMSLPIQVSGMVFVLTASIFIKKIAALLTENIYVQHASVFFTLFYYPINNWSVVLGTEVSLLLLLLTSAVYLLLKGLTYHRFSLLPFLLLGVSTWVRMDMIVPAVVCMLYAVITSRTNRKRYFITSVLTILLFVSIQIFVRLWYFGEMLPNTYYLKLTGYPILLRMARGVYVLKSVMNWLLLLIPLVVLLLKKQRVFLFLLMLFVGQIVYSIYVGGDAWEFFGGSNRYITIGMPFFFLVLLMSFKTLYFKVFGRNRKNPNALGVLGSSLVVFSVLLSFHLQNDTMLLQAMLLRSPQTVGENRQQTNMAYSVCSHTSATAEIGVVWAGTIPYFCERSYLDLLGKNDKIIARQKAHMLGSKEGIKRYLGFYPGHMKWDTGYILSKKPDAFIQIYPDEARKVVKLFYRKYVDEYGYEWYVRNDTKKVNISKLHLIN